jgi:hypothetical protein
MAAGLVASFAPMFIGHFALGLAAKPAAPKVSLGALFLACQLLDLVWPVLVLTGIERVSVKPGMTAFTPLDFEYYPWSHSLVAAVILACLAAVVAFAWRRAWRSGLVLGGLVLSHWVLDWISHRPDLPLVPGGSTRVGVGLWDTVAGTMVVELGLFGLGLGLYLRSRGPRTKAARVGFVALIGFLMLVYLANAFGPTPPPTTPGAAIAGPALAMWILVLWAALVDRPIRLPIHDNPVAPSGPQ